MYSIVSAYVVPHILPVCVLPGMCPRSRRRLKSTKPAAVQR